MLDVTDMIPNKWEIVCRRYRYILAFDGVDVFLLKGDFNPAARTILRKNSLDNILQEFKKPLIEIEILDPIAPSGAQRFLNWIRCPEESGFGEEITIKMLDPVGYVVQMYQFTGIMLVGDHDDYDDYDGEGSFSVRFSYDSVLLKSSS